MTNPMRKLVKYDSRTGKLRDIRPIDPTREWDRSPPPVTPAMREKLHHARERHARRQQAAWDRMEEQIWGEQ